MYILWTFQILLTWGTASMVCDTRQAKRLFPLFSSGGILGAAVGGLVTKALVRWIGTENLLLIWVGTLIIAFVLIHLLIKDIKEKRGNHHRRRKSLIADLGRGYQYVWKSGLMRWTSLTVMLLGLLYFMIAFPFSRAAAAQFPDEDILAGFFGIFHGVTTATALLASLLMANRFYARFGFMAAMLVFPIIYFVGFSVLAVRSAFFMLIAFRFLQMSWLQGVSGPAYQAVFNIVPSERREQSRVFIDRGLVGKKKLRRCSCRCTA
jgi:AAA family ATP:ADP antiporter